MNQAGNSARIKYKKPPIVERVLKVVGDIAPENFFAKFDSWRELIQSRYPDYEPLKDWRLNVEVKDGVPVFTDAPPQVLITHRFSHRNPQGKRLLSMRVMSNELAIHLHRDSEKPHFFEELLAEAENWIPQWFNHFGVKGCNSVVLDYVNLLSTATTPSFVQGNSIRVGNMLTVFSSVPSQHCGIIPPYDCQMGLMIDPDRPATFALRVLGLIAPPQIGASIRVDFHAEVAKDSPQLSAQQVLAESQFLHRIIIDQFETLFTPDAKQSFEPL